MTTCAIADDDDPGGETVGQLWERLPHDEWVDLPEYGVRVRAWKDTPPIGRDEPRR